jgi:hypothetical protein
MRNESSGQGISPGCGGHSIRERYASTTRRAKRNELTQDQLKSVIDYDPVTGVFTWKVDVATTVPAGSEAGYVDAWGYRQIRIGNVLYQSHRLAFLYMMGRFPEMDVDHINRNSSDNRWENLRECTRTVNLLNRAPLGEYRGITMVTSYGKPCWRVQFSNSGKKGYYGTYPTKEEAARRFNEVVLELRPDLAEIPGYLNNV